jgi:hypothetical protein
VGIIALSGFVVGMAWPWLAGVKLVPSPPTDEASEAAVAPGPSGSPSAVLAAVPGSPSNTPPETEAPPHSSEESVKVSDLKVTGCKDDGKKLKDCDRIQFDGVARPKLGNLAHCDAAKGSSEMLSIGFELDFEKRAVTDVFAGKSTTFSKEGAKALVECAKAEFANVTLDGVDHEHSRYTAFYFVEFLPPGSTAVAPGAPEETQAASGLATVAWDVAVVRDTPEDGKILTRLRYGTRVIVTGRRSKWYEIKYDAKGQKGWVNRNALGL